MLIDLNAIIVIAFIVKIFIIIVNKVMQFELMFVITKTIMALLLLKLVKMTIITVNSKVAIIIIVEISTIMATTRKNFIITNAIMSLKGQN